MDPSAVIPDLFPEVEPYNGNTDENQRFTILRARNWCKHVAGVTEWDLDAAACREAHHAPVWYGGIPFNGKNGLVEPWFGDTFCNPPWADIGPWTLKAWRSWSAEADRQREEAGLPSLISISMLLPGGRTHRPWWKEFVEPFRDGRRRYLDLANIEHPATLETFNPPERFPYGGPGNPEGVGAPEPNFTSVLLVWRRT